MTSWSHGYVSDIEYLPGFYPDQTPGHLQLACILNGYEPPLSAQNFRYCELGCGQGTTASVIAAANPLAHVIAIDFNPAQIARAKRRASDYGLTNIDFLELSFEELKNDTKLRDFDIVSLHGVWSWISQSDRDAIVGFLAGAVKPGGLVSLSYNCMPGWTSLLPFQRMLLEHSRLTKSRSDQRVVNSLEFIEKLEKLGCQTVGNKEFFARFQSKNKIRNEHDHAVYLAHEYLNENWEPLYHIDTARMLEPAKLNFIASATLLDNFSDLMLTPEQREILDAIPPGAMREMAKDYFVNRPFRRDIYIRGAQKVSDARRNELLGRIGLASIIDNSTPKFTINTPAGEATLPEKKYQPIFDALNSRPHSIQEIDLMLKALEFEQTPSMVEIAGILVGTGQAVALPWGLNVPNSFSTTLYNRRVVETVVNQEMSMVALASPLSSSGMNINAVEAVVYGLSSAGVNDDDLLSQSLDQLSHSSYPIAIDGKIVDEPEEIANSLKAGVEWSIKNRLPLWKQLKMI
jgi:SAM-dependent methyltransferase